MRILCVPDLHCYPTAHSYPTDSGMPSRLLEWQEAALKMVDLAVSQKVDVALAPGDYYVNSRPPDRARIEIDRLFKTLESHGIRVIGCGGNHDFVRPGEPGPVDALGHLSRSDWGITHPGGVWLEDLQLFIGVMPWRSYTSVDAMTEALEAEARRLAEEADAKAQNPASRKVLMGHWGIKGARTSSGHSLDGEPALDVPFLASLGFDAIVLGHIHVPQVFSERPPVLHTGALLRQNFGEEHDERGCYILDLGSGDPKVQWHPLDVQRFWTLRLDEPQLEALAHGSALDEVADLNPAQGAICRIAYQCSEELHHQLDHDAMIRALHEAGARSVTGLAVDILRFDRRRVEGLSEQTSHEQALQAWLDLREDLSDEIKARVLAETHALMKEVMHDG